MSGDSREIPSSWVNTTIGAVAEINPPASTVTAHDDQEVTFVPMAAVEALTGRIDTSQRRRFGEVKKGFTRFREGDVLMAKITPSMENGKIAVVRRLDSGIGCGSTEFHVLRPDAELESDYLRYFLVQAKYRREAERNMQGAVGQQRVPAHFIRNSSIPVPPIGEQRRIVRRLDEVFARIGDAERECANARRRIQQYYSSLLHAAVSGRLTSSWRRAMSSVEQADQNRDAVSAPARRDGVKAPGVIASDAGRLVVRGGHIDRLGSALEKGDWPNLPKNWLLCRLDDVSERVTDGTHQPPPFVGSGVPFLTIGQVRPGKIFWSEVAKWVNEATYIQYTRTMRPQRGDVLYTAVGSYGMAVAIETDTKFMFQRHIAHIRPRPGVIRPRYLEALLNSPICRKRADRVARGVAQKTVTLGELRDFTIPLPPLNEQDRILALLDVERARLESYEAAASEVAIRCSGLREAILQSAFVGRLTR